MYEGFIYIRMKRQLLLGEAISTWQVIRQQIAISPWIHHIPRALRAPFRALGAFFSGGRAAPRALGMKREMDAKGEQPFTIPSPCEGAPEPGGPRSTRAAPAQHPRSARTLCRRPPARLRALRGSRAPPPGLCAPLLRRSAPPRGTCAPAGRANAAPDAAKGSPPSPGPPPARSAAEVSASAMPALPGP